jgi:RNA polymerase sigma-70 factor (ECF subfamily)
VIQARSQPPVDPLIQRLRQGDEAAFTQLVQRFHGPLRRLALGVLGNGAAADEVVQDTWAAVLEGLASFEGRASLKTWLFRICVNKARTRRVRDQRSTPLSALEPEDDDGPAVDPGRFDARGHWNQTPDAWTGERSPESEVLRGELGRFLEKALAELPERYRVVLTLRDLEGMESDEVCNVLAITESNQRVLLHRARSRVRAALEAYLAGGAKP